MLPRDGDGTSIQSGWAPAAAVSPPSGVTVTCAAARPADITTAASVPPPRVEMFVNNALDDDEVAEGFVLTCQSVPNEDVHVVYGA